MNPPDQPTPDLAPTPRTDAAYFATGATMYSLAGEMKLLERELTETERLRFGADAERRQLRCDLFDAKWECERLKFALVEWEAKERGWSKAVEKDAAELTRLRAEVERWELAFQEQYARALERELIAVQAECEMLTTEILERAALNREVMRERDSLESEITRLRAELASKAACYDIACGEVQRLRAEVERLKGALALGQQNCDDTYDDLREERDEAIARAEKAEAELAEWSVLKGWGGTPEIVHKFIKGQQNRIHHCQDLEAELITERARLDYLGLHMGTRMVAEALNCDYSKCFPIRDAIDLAMKNETNP